MHSGIKGVNHLYVVKANCQFGFAKWEGTFRYNKDEGFVPPMTYTIAKLNCIVHTLNNKTIRFFFGVVFIKSQSRSIVE
jgi:hypothetical protein